MIQNFFLYISPSLTPPQLRAKTPRWKVFADSAIWSVEWSSLALDGIERRNETRLRKRKVREGYTAQFTGGIHLHDAYSPLQSRPLIPSPLRTCQDLGSRRNYVDSLQRRRTTGTSPLCHHCPLQFVQTSHRLCHQWPLKDAGGNLYSSVFL